MHHDTLFAALQTADMLEIDGLHAWEFTLEPTQLAALEAGQPGDGGAPFLRVECMDGRTRREWRFSLAAVQAASFDAANVCWTLDDPQGSHTLRCLDAFIGSDDDGAEE
ncbi:DUF5629 family protein [Pseudomonas boanensis]|uniref:DUF5629 family protein n=1 Tax=Metapseudomonas boanensis TaxID=2822138 RepID=UPI0035D44A7C